MKSNGYARYAIKRVSAQTTFPLLRTSKGEVLCNYLTTLVFRGERGGCVDQRLALIPQLGWASLEALTSPPPSPAAPGRRAGEEAPGPPPHRRRGQLPATSPLCSQEPRSKTNVADPIWERDWLEISRANFLRHARSRTHSLRTRDRIRCCWGLSPPSSCCGRLPARLSRCPTALRAGRWRWGRPTTPARLSCSAASCKPRLLDPPPACHELTPHHVAP